MFCFPKPPGHILLLVLAILMPCKVIAECSAVSGPQRTALLELYTSEGCSSCPPADRWFSGLAANGRVVPLALHVDYWDYIGWKDRYAQRGFATRQRDMASVVGSGLVYTPQFLLNGRDYRRWTSAARFKQDILVINQSLPRADIRLSIDRLGSGSVVVQVQATSKEDDARLFAALYENELVSVVQAGENGGETLHHDHVVMTWLGPLPINTPVTKELAIPRGGKSGKLGVAAFVQKAGTGEVLQALSLPLCEPSGS